MTIQIGLALSGGGARGIAHVGVLQVLEEAQIPIHVLAGTSMGGIVAAAYAAGHSPAEIEQLFRSLRLLDIAQRDRTGLGLLGQGKIAGRLREALGGDLTFDQLELPLALVAVDLETGEEVVIREGLVVEGLLATSAVPVVFSPARWQGRLLVDGGVLNNVPFDVARRMGADRVIAVHTMRDLSGEIGTESPPAGSGAEAIVRMALRRAPWSSIIEVAERSSGITSRRLVEQRMRESPPDLMIEVKLKGVGLFDLDQVDMGIKAGKKAARQRLPELLDLCDTSLPKRITHWWRKLRQRLPG
ncbi:MAG TPA: patatin-like phospholipase family protein [Thermoflexia bacterium]|nr:patatin-like phospholipase family protein [Thermoflexia bacterium]